MASNLKFSFSRLVFQSIEHELMAAQSVDGQFVDILQTLFDVVGVECGQRPHHLHLFASKAEDIGECPHHHAKVAMIGRHHGQELLQPFAHANGTAAGTSTAVRRGEGLVQVDVHHIEAHVARACSAEHGVEVGAIVIHQTSAIVDQFCNLRNTRLEEAEGIGIGHHHGSDLCALLIYDALQVVVINRPVSQRFYFNNLQAADSCRGRIGAMGRIGIFLPWRLAF